MKNLLLDADGRLRFIWRAVIFALLAQYALPFALNYPLTPLYNALHIPDGLSASGIAFGEVDNLVVAILCTIPFALYEHRGLFSYGLSWRPMSLPQLGEGAFVGAVIAGGIALGMIALGGMQVHGLALGGGALLASSLAWLAANIFVGFGEEYFFRGYFLQSLWRSLGFWPASIIIALLFAADHYFFKAGENIWDVITLIWFSLLICYSVLRSGTLWFAVGLHIAFDYMQLFVIGTQNGSLYPAGRLLDATFNGPAWLTGGVLGTEASFLIYPLLALATLYVGWRFRGLPDFDPTAS